MKLIISIVQDDDALDLVEDLTEKGYGVTKLATTGGFLKSGNTTLLTGVNAEKVDEVIEVIKSRCKTREEVISAMPPVIGVSGNMMPYPVYIKAGGATIFVVDVDKFIKV